MISTPQTSNPKRAIIYKRVSTEEQSENYSLQHQEEVLTKYCQIHKIEIDSVYTEDYSAKTFKRPEFTKLLTYARANKKIIDYLLIIKWDRFSRNVSQAFQMIEAFEPMNIEILALEQPLDMSVPES